MTEISTVFSVASMKAYVELTLFNGFQKKTQKTPQGEIDKAKRIMNEYFESKNKKGE